MKPIKKKPNNSFLSFFLAPFRIAAISGKKFYSDDCFTLSSSISFVFILSIIPFATLNLFIFSTLQKMFFPEQFMVENIKNFIAREMTHFIPLISEEWVKTNIFQSLNSLKSFKIINFVLLPVIGSLVFKTLETSYRRIFRLSGRHLLFGQILHAVLAISIVLMLFITSFTWNIISAPLHQLTDQLNGTAYFASIDHFMNNNPFLANINFLSIFIILVFYMVTIKIFLNVKINTLYILFSGITFCGLWILARLLFQTYIEHVSKVNIIYGSLSSIIIILLWIFYSSIALLFSVELLYVLHSHD